MDGLYHAPSGGTLLHYYRVQTKYPGWTACTTRPLAAPPHLLSTTTTDWSLDRVSLTGTCRTVQYSTVQSLTDRYRQDSTVQYRVWLTGTGRTVQHYNSTKALKQKTGKLYDFLQIISLSNNTIKLYLNYTVPLKKSKYYKLNLKPVKQ